MSFFKNVGSLVSKFVGRERKEAVPRLVSPTQETFSTTRLGLEKRKPLQELNHDEGKRRIEEARNKIYSINYESIDQVQIQRDIQRLKIAYESVERLLATSYWANQERVFRANNRNAGEPFYFEQAQLEGLKEELTYALERLESRSLSSDLRRDALNMIREHDKELYVRIGREDATFASIKEAVNSRAKQLESLVGQGVRKDSFLDSKERYAGLSRRFAYA